MCVRLIIIIKNNSLAPKFAEEKEIFKKEKPKYNLNENMCGSVCVCVV